MANSMAVKKAQWITTARWIYWTVTLLFVSTMMVAGLTYLLGASFNVEGITHLGYPVYLLKILGTAKLLGGIAILQGRFRTLKEWAYAGYTFNLLGASASHALYGDPFVKVQAPIIILAFVLVSYRQWKTGWM
jgi:uncharacterized membrane protein YphA (DoxX/SURF4 family)